MYRTIKADSHHLRYAARIVAIRLVDLRLQYRPHVPRLDTDHWQACFGKCAEKPLRYRPAISAGRDDQWTHRNIHRRHIATGLESNRHGPDSLYKPTQHHTGRPAS